MELLVDIGNTATKFACIDKGNFSFLGRCFNYELIDKKINEILKKVKKVRSVHVASVVPGLNVVIDTYFINNFGVKPTYVKLGDYPDLKVVIDHPDELGMDLYCDLIGGLAKFGPGLLVVDLGTATKILLIDKDSTFNSCVIVPGIEMSKKMLSSGTALLPEVGERDIKKISEARNTNDVINSSIYYGHVEMINGLIRRYMDEIGYKCRIVVTGGNSTKVMWDIKGPYILDEYLCLEGIAETIKGK